ncbi:hypothetical protein BGZ46_009790, partial [Entomortierella lignicola]
IEIPLDLNVVTRTLPSAPRAFFKVPTSMSGNMSNTMIILDISRDPLEPKLCFRGASQHDINHWVRIFNSLNAAAVPSSPMLGGGLNSPNPGEFPSGRMENQQFPSSVVGGGLTSERKRNHTFTNTSLATSLPPTTMPPSISPALISNAAAAISSMNGGNAGSSSNPPTTLHSHYRNNGSKTENASMTKEDIRRRAITEPRLRLVTSLQIPQSQRGGSPKNVSRASKPEQEAFDSITSATSQRSADLSNFFESPFQLDSPPGRKHRPVLGTEYLDKASQVLLATSSARSSTAPMYSGYIWLYLPNTSTDTTKSLKKVEYSVDSIAQESEGVKDTTVIDGSDTKVAASMTSLLSPSISIHSSDSHDDLKSISGSSPGRYVKCFALISDQGHFQWVEVKKLNDQEPSENMKTKMKGITSPMSSSRSSYGVQLKHQRQVVDYFEDYEDSSNAAEREQELAKRNLYDESVQVSMMESVNMFFFCVKIPPRVVNDVLVTMNNVEASSPAHVHPAVASPAISSVSQFSNVAVAGNETVSQSSSSHHGSIAKAASKIRHRLSSSLSTLTTSSSAAAVAAAAALPPLPGNNNNANSRPQSTSSGSISKNKNNMTWPLSSYDSESMHDSVGHHNHHNHHNHSHSMHLLPHQERAMTASDISSSSSSSLPVSRKESFASLRSNLPNITTSVSQLQQLHQQQQSGPVRSDNDLGGGITNSQMFASPNSATFETLSPPLAVPSSPAFSNSSSASLSPSTRNVLSLAHNLQEAVKLNQQQSNNSSAITTISEAKDNVEQVTAETTRVSPPTSGSSSDGSVSWSSTAGTIGSSSVGVKPRITLSEAMVANQSAIPDCAATLERNKQQQQQLGQCEKNGNGSGSSSNKQIHDQEMCQRVQKAEERIRQMNNRTNAKQSKKQQQQRDQQQQQQSQQNQKLQCQQSQQPEQNKSQAKAAEEVIPFVFKTDCPFLELSTDADGSGESFVLLRGYTESEDEWKALQCALDKILDQPIKRQPSALPPQDTLIPSYHSPVEVQLSEKAERFLSAKESLIEEANLAASKAAVDAARSPTPDLLSGGTIPTANGPVAQIRATSVSMTRWMNLSGGKDRSDRGDRVDRDGNNGNKAKAYLGNISPLFPTTPTMPSSPSGVFNNSEGNGTHQLSAREGVTMKRGISPSHSLSVGSGTSQFRPRPRLHQQRSADQLSRSSPFITAADPNHNRASSQHDGGSLYSTATAIMPSNNNERIGGGLRLKSIFKGRTTPVFDEDNHQHHLEGGKFSSHKMEKATSETGRSGWEPTIDELPEGARIETAMTKAKSVVAEDTDVEEERGQQDGLRFSFEELEHEYDVAVEGAATGKRDSKSSIQSLYTHGQQLAIEEVESSKNRGKSRKLSNSSNIYEYETTVVIKEASPKDSNSNQRSLSLDSESVMTVIGTVETTEGPGTGATNARTGLMSSFMPLPVRNKNKDVGLHPLEKSSGVEVKVTPPVASGGSCGGSGSSSGGGSSSGKRTHQTVKAAVNGVLGKFRKSVG